MMYSRPPFCGQSDISTQWHEGGREERESDGGREGGGEREGERGREREGGEGERRREREQWYLEPGSDSIDIPRTELDIPRPITEMSPVIHDNRSHDLASPC